MKRKLNRKRLLRFFIPYIFIQIFALLVYFNRDNDSFEYLIGFAPITFLWYNIYLDRYDND